MLFEIYFTLVKILFVLLVSIYCYISMYDFIYAAIQSVNFSDIRCDIPELKGDNYKV